MKLHDYMKPVPEDPRSTPLTPVERLAMEFELTGHQDEANALLLLDATFSRICAAHPDTLTKCALELQDQLVEALESWLPPDLEIISITSPHDDPGGDLEIPPIDACD